MPNVLDLINTGRKRLLDPIERSSEVLFGLVMVLTFTGSFRAAGADHDSVERMLVAALGCNLAWGVIDAVMYLLAALSQRGHNLMLLREVQTAKPARGRRLVGDAMSDDVAAVLTDAEFESIRARLLQVPEPRAHARLHPSDFQAAFGVFLLVFCSTFPVVLPFLFMKQPSQALRVSSLIGIIMLFLTGVAYGKFAGANPWRVGVIMVLIGIGMVALTIVLGG